MSIFQLMPEREPNDSGSWSKKISPSTHASAFSKPVFNEKNAALRQFIADVSSGSTVLQTYFPGPAGSLGSGENLRHSSLVLSKRPQWRDAEYRQAYAEAAVEQGLAWQLKINRMRRKMSQSEMAQKLDTQQSAVSRMEDPEYGSHSLPMLLKAAHVFDCALIVKFVSYAALADESEHLSEDELYAPTYEEVARTPNHE